MINCRPCLILLLHDDILERTVADIGEFVPRGGWNIRECSRHDVDLADAFLILDLGLAAAHGCEWQTCIAPGGKVQRATRI